LIIGGHVTILLYLQGVGVIDSLQHCRSSGLIATTQPRQPLADRGSLFCIWLVVTTLVVVLATTLVVLLLYHDQTAVPISVMAPPVAVPVATSVSITHSNSDTANIDIGAFRDNHRLAGNDQRPARTGVVRNGRAKMAKTTLFMNVPAFYEKTESNGSHGG
jgi:hypothetical protein